MGSQTNCFVLLPVGALGGNGFVRISSARLRLQKPFLPCELLIIDSCLGVLSDTAQHFQSLPCRTVKLLSDLT